MTSSQNCPTNRRSSGLHLKSENEDFSVILEQKIFIVPSCSTHRADKNALKRSSISYPKYEL